MSAGRDWLTMAEAAQRTGWSLPKVRRKLDENGINQYHEHPTRRATTPVRIVNIVDLQKVYGAALPEIETPSQSAHETHETTKNVHMNDHENVNETVNTQAALVALTAAQDQLNILQAVVRDLRADLDHERRERERERIELQAAFERERAERIDAQERLIREIEQNRPQGRPVTGWQVVRRLFGGREQ